MIAEGMTSTIVEASGEDSVRMGINLGPVKLVKDINGHPNIIGDGINVAQRIMSFARPGQIVVSRSYYDVVSNLASEYAKLFHYEGSRTDKHVREHEIYVVGHHEGALQKAKDGMKDRASSTTPNQKTSATGASTVTLSMPAFVQDKKKLTFVAAGLAGLVLILGILVVYKKPSSVDVAAASPPPATTPATGAQPAAGQPTTAQPTTAQPATQPQSEPPKPVDTSKAETKPDTKVLEPTPPASAVPPAAPVPSAESSDKAARDVKKEGEKAVKDKAAADAASKGETKGDASKPGLPPATLVFAITPWGEIFVNGKSRGVTPPMKSIKLEPGKYKIEIRNTTFPPHAEIFELRARDEITVRHKFQ
jgi:hypothetical protein